MSRTAQARVVAAQASRGVDALAHTVEPARSPGSDLQRDEVCRLLTADDLAARWSVTPKQVYRLAREGDLPAVKIGRYYRFRLAAVEAWEADQEARAGTKYPPTNNELRGRAHV